MKKQIKRINIVDFLINLIIFFVPYTSFRILGLKISELLTLLLITLSGTNKLFNLKTKEIASKFLFAFSIVIILSGIMSFVDPINQYVTGNDAGIYYSFEFGWIFRLIRLLIVFIFMSILKKRIQGDMLQLIRCCNVYILSCILVGISGIIKILKTSDFIIGITRTPLMAVEASEAGFINSFGIIISFFSFFRFKERKYFLCTFVLLIVQLAIGSTASLLAGATAILISLIDYVNRESKNLLKKTLFYMIVIMVGILCMYYLVNKTQLLSKIINYKYFMTIRGSSVAERLTAIETCLTMFLKRPILGVGIGNFGWYLSSFVTSDYLIFVPGGNFQPNTLYFQLLAELGIVGFSIYIIFIFRMIREVCSILKYRKKYHYGNMLLAMIIYILIHNLTLTTLYSFQFWMLVACVMAFSKYGGKNDFY